MAENITYIIYKEEVENSLNAYSFDEYDKYKTTKMEGDKKVFDGYVSGIEIERNKIAEIPSTEYSEWLNAVSDYLEAHNIKAVNNETGIAVEYVILDMDDRGLCDYEKSMNGGKVDEGKGWLKDINNETEREAWIKAVREYKKENGIEMPTDEIDKKLEEIDNAMNLLDSELPLNFELIPPMMLTALEKIQTDPCNFVSAIKQAATSGVVDICGVPSPVELKNYYVKLYKDNIQTIKEIENNPQGTIVKPLITPIKDEVWDFKSYFEELDAADQEYKKTHSDDIALFEVCMEEPYEYTSTYKYDEVEETSYEGVSADELGNVDPPTSDSFTRTTYKEVNPTLIAKGGTLRSSNPNQNVPSNIYRNIYSGLQNCWIPLRIAWESYCKQKGWNPTWTITSGYRPPDKNENISSAHQVGYAIDIQPYFTTQDEKRERVTALCSFIYQYCKQHREIKIDQLIKEFNSNKTDKNGNFISIWCHLGYKSPSSKQRGEYYANYDKVGGHGTKQYV